MKESLYYNFGTAIPTNFMVVTSSKGICGLFLGSDREKLAQEMHARFPAKKFDCSLSALPEYIQGITAFINAPNTPFSLPLDLQGTPFQQEVWRALALIPCGNTKYYSQIAEEIGRPKAVRAVANACGSNPVAIIIPCHRVVGKNGSLTGFFYGLELKQTLLDLETALRQA